MGRKWVSRLHVFLESRAVGLSQLLPRWGGATAPDLDIGNLGSWFKCKEVGAVRAGGGQLWQEAPGLGLTSQTCLTVPVGPQDMEWGARAAILRADNLDSTGPTKHPKCLEAASQFQELLSKALAHHLCKSLGDLTQVPAQRPTQLPHDTSGQPTLGCDILRTASPSHQLTSALPVPREHSTLGGNSVVLPATRTITTAIQHPSSTSQPCSGQGWS